VSAEERLLPRYWCSNAFIRGALIAAAAILLPTMLLAQQDSPEVTPPLPGMSWGSPPTEADWEPTTQGGANEGPQDQSGAREHYDEAAERRQEQVLIAQQAMAEQAKRMADLMFWQLVLGVAVLAGLGITIYYVHQIARAVNLGREASPIDRARGLAQPVQPQRAEGNQQRRAPAS
jgi:hypothetical protein